MTTTISVVNESLELIGAQTTITALNDGSPAGNAAGVLYAPAVNMLLRQLDPAFARRMAFLAIATTPAMQPWSYEYAYLADCLRVRQIAPPATGYNVNDPQPVRWQVALDVISGTPTKVVLTNQQGALAVYTSSTPGVGQEALWDSIFIEAVARRLANPLAMALAGRPDFAKEILEESQAFAQMAETADEM